LNKTIAWFSGGVSSAVSIKLIVDKIDQIIYQHIDDQHPDTLRFIKDCEVWFGKPVEIIQHAYKSVENACRMQNFINSPHGAGCTRTLKRRLRMEWELEHRFFNWFTYVWGIDKEEAERAERLKLNMPEEEHLFPLIDRGLTKQDAHGILKESGIKRPKMYDLGYPNNNCVGCVKGGMGYWNKIRIDFPEVFASRAKMERLIGASCINGIYLDELNPQRGIEPIPIVQDCGAMCEENRG